MGKGKSVKTATEFEIQRRILRKAFITSLFVFLLVLSGAFVGWYFANSAVEGRQIQKFQNLGSAMANAIQEQMNQYIDVIYDAKRFFANSEVVTRDEWRTFLSPVIVQNRYPGVRAVRFIRRVREREKGAFIQEVKLDTSLVPGGYPQFDIHSTVSLESQFTEVNKEYYPVTYVEPYVGNETMLGLDVHTDPSVWAQYQASISTDEPMIDSVILVDTDKVDAFKLCLAIYAKNLPLNTFQERMSAVNGFVDLLVIKKYFFEPSFTQKNLYKDIRYEVFEGEITNEREKAKMIYRSTLKHDEETFHRQNPFEFQQKVQVVGKVWTICFFAPRSFAREEAGTEQPWIVLAGGLLVSFILWAVMYTLSTSRLRAVQLARHITQELRESELRYRAIIESANDAIILSDEKGLISGWNSSAEKIFGYQPTEIIGKEISTLTPESYRDRHRQGFARYLSTGESKLIGRTVEMVALKKDGSEFPAELSLSSWKAEAGTFFSAVVRDLSEQKKIQEELKQAEKALIDREHFSMVAQLAAGVAHEVKNPLAIILQGTDYLKGAKELNGGSTLEVLNNITDAVQRADHIVKGLLEFSRPQGLNLRSEDVNVVIDTSLHLVKNLLDKNAIEVVKKYQDHLPEVAMDRGKIEQALINLFTNAIEAMGEHGRLTIHTRLSTNRDEIRMISDGMSLADQGIFVGIEDTGPGIPPQVMPKLFTPFITSKRAKGGSGLGLSMVRSIIAMHKGAVSITNLKEGGARAIIAFLWGLAKQ